MQKIDDLITECNTFKINHDQTIAHETDLLSNMTNLPIYRTNLKTLIDSLTETIEIMKKHYKCYENCSRLTAEANELNERLKSYEDKLSSESLIHYQLNTLQVDLQNITIKIDSLKDKFRLQEFPNELSSIESNDAIGIVMQPMLRKIQTLQMKLRQYKNKNRILKLQLENKCKEAISEYQDITSWIERVTNDMQNNVLPKFKDYIQAQLRKRYDYLSIVTKCKHEIEKYHSECNFKNENIKMKELIAKTISFQIIGIKFQFACTNCFYSNVYLKSLKVGRPHTRM